MYCVVWLRCFSSDDHDPGKSFCVVDVDDDGDC